MESNRAHCLRSMAEAKLLKIAALPRYQGVDLDQHGRPIGYEAVMWADVQAVLDDDWPPAWTQEEK